MHACGSDPDGPPNWLGFAIGDTGTGLYAAYACDARLHQPPEDGGGRIHGRVDVRLHGRLGRADPQRLRDVGSGAGRGPDPLIAPWCPFPCKDGYVTLIVRVRRCGKSSPPP